jgi:RNA polymerase sigma-70 factor (ECF subfamily)
MVLRRCRRLLRDEELAVEVMHDVFLALHDRRLRLEDRGLSSLLFRMATHRSLNTLRGRARRPEQPDALLDRIACAPDVEERGLARLLLDRLFGQTEASTREMAVLHLVDGLTLAEVASSVGMSVSGVRLRLQMLRDQVPELSEV